MFAYDMHIIKNLLTYLLPVFIVEQNLLGVSAAMLAVIYRHLGIHMTLHRALMHHVCDLANRVLTFTNAITT